MKLTYSEILDTFNALEKTEGYLNEKWPKIQAFLKGKKRFVFIGSGSSYSLAKSMAAMTAMTAGLPAFALAAGDILLHAERYSKCFAGAAVVCVSRSGRTSELLLALDAVKATGVSFKTASLVCADNTPLEAKSSLTLSTPWAFDKSVCQTRSVTNFYYIAASIVARATGNKTLADDLAAIRCGGKAFLKKAETLADSFAAKPWTHCVVLADGELAGLGEEAALAFKEICQLPSNSYHLLDVRHGPMVLINEKTLTVAALGAKNELEAKLIADVAAKKSEVVFFSDTAVKKIDVGTQSVFGKTLTHLARGIPFIMLCQMIAYKKSLVTGADPDKPTGLEAWIAL